MAFADGPDKWSFLIPPEDVLLRETAIADGTPEIGQKHAAFPGVTGTIDLQRGTVSMVVKVTTKIKVDVLGEFDGLITTDLSGTLVYPDADGDGVPNRGDNCRLVSNPDQRPVPPFIRAPRDVTLPTCVEERIGQPIALDLCEGGPVTVANNAPHPYPPRSTVVTWSATNSHGRMGTDTQTVTIVDTTPPVITSMPPDIT